MNDKLLWLIMNSEKNNWSYIIIAYASLFVLGLLDNARGPYFPDILEDLELTDSQSGLFLLFPHSLLLLQLFLRAN